MLRKSYLNEHRPELYSSYFLAGKLTAHLNEIDQQTNKRIEILLNQMVCAGAVNNIWNAAEEIVLNEIVYI